MEINSVLLPAAFTAYVVVRLFLRGAWPLDVVYISALAVYKAAGGWPPTLAAVYTLPYLLGVAMVTQGKLAKEAGMAAAVSYTGVLLIATGVAHLQLLGFAMATLAPAALLPTMGDRGSLEGLFRYLVISSIAVSFMAVGLATRPDYPEFGDFFIFMAVAAELGAVPLHLWVPDVYGRSRPAGLAALASLPKLAAGFALLYVRPEVGALAAYGLGALSMLVGNLGALTSGDLRRVLAYSTVAHAGFALFAYPLSPQVALLLIMADALGKMALFNHLEAGSGRWAAYLLAMNQIGVPPALGFWPKLYLLLLAAYTLGPHVGVYLLANIALSVPYYFRVARDLPSGVGPVAAAIAVVLTAASAGAPLWLSHTLSLS